MGKVKKNKRIEKKYYRDLIKKSLNLGKNYLLLVFSIIAVLLVFRNYGFAGWSIKTVDSGIGNGSSSSIALDEKGWPHIGYWDFINGKVKYAKWDGVSWSTYTTGDLCAPEGNPSGERISIALDDSGNPHISCFYTVTNGWLKHFWWEGGGWNEEIVDNSNNWIGAYSSIDVDENGNPHISYTDGINYDLKYTRWDNIDSQWEMADGTAGKETVDSVNQVGNDTSLALDGSNYAHISYEDTTNQSLKYAKWNGVSWDIQTVDDPANDVGEYSSIALDENDYPHISYYDRTDENLKYTRWNGSDWCKADGTTVGQEIVDSPDNAGSFTSIALDGNGYPHITYLYNSVPTGTRVRYAYWTGSSWKSQIDIDIDVGDVGGVSSIALDTACYSPHISYHSNYDDLKYALWINTPTVFTGTVISTSEIKWSWIDNEEGEEAYRVQTDTNGIIAILNPNTTYWVESNLSPNTQYIRHANVLKDGGDDDSNSDSVYTYANIPTNLSVSDRTVSSISLDWNGDGTRYAVEKSTNGSNWSYIIQWSDNVTSTNHTDSPLNPHTSYWYRVRAYNGDQSITTASTDVSTTTYNSSPDIPTNTSPSNNVYITTTTPNLIWSAFSDADGDSQSAYQIQLRISTGTYSDANAEDTGEIPGSTNVYATGSWNLEDGKKYFWKVRVKDNSGYLNNWSAYSAETSFKIDTSVNAISLISSESHPDENVKYCNDSPVVSWESPADLNNIVGYYYKIDHSSFTTPSPSKGTYTTSKSVSLSGLDDGTWYFHIVAKDNLGNIGTEAVHLKIKIKTYVDINQDNVFIKEDGTKLEIPAGALDSTTKVNILVPSDVVAIPYDTTLKETGIAREFSLEDGTKKFKKEITITIPYTDSDISGLDEDKLRMFWWDSDNGIWGLVKDSKVYPDENKVVGNTDHFSIFAIMEFSLSPEALSGLSNYPNPFVAKKEKTKIRYTLKEDLDVEIKIYDLLGDLVFKNNFLAGNRNAQEGPNEFSWDGKDGNDNWVAAGAYICRVKAGNKTEIVKIGVK